MATLASHFGGTAHLSPLLRKVKGLGLATPDALLRLAVARGCWHYAPAGFRSDEVQDPGVDRLSDVELAIAMISGAQEYDPQRMRCAAQLLSGDSLNAREIARLARMERCVPAIAYIARLARELDDARRNFWVEILNHLPPIERVNALPLWPHPSRFVSLAGYRRGGAHSPPVWLRPHSPGVSA